MVKKIPVKESLQEILEAEEILRHELDHIKAEEELAKEKVHQLKLKQLSRNEVCCEDVCDTVNSMVKNIGKKIDELESVHERHLSTSIDKSSVRELHILRERHDELKDMIQQLKERSVCDCIAR